MFANYFKKKIELNYYLKYILLTIANIVIYIFNFIILTCFLDLPHSFRTRLYNQNLICICILGGGRPATSITIFDKTENSFKVTWQSNYQQNGKDLHYIVWLYHNNQIVERKETTYNYIPLLFNQNILSNNPYRIAIQARSPSHNEYGDIVDFQFITPIGMHLRN